MAPVENGSPNPGRIPDAGFASKSTFNQAFKKLTAQTPADFQQTVGT